MITDQQCRRCYHLGIAATDKSPPEQQECRNKKDDAGTHRIECDTQITNHDKAKDTEYGHRDHQGIRNSEGFNVVICGDDKEDNPYNQD